MPRHPLRQLPQDVCHGLWAPHPMTEVQINAREQRLQNSPRASISVTPAPAPAHGRSRAMSMAQSRPPALAPAPVPATRPRRQSTTAPPPLAQPSTSVVQMPAAYYPVYSYVLASAMPVATSRPAPSPYAPSPYSSQYVSTGPSAPTPYAYPTHHPSTTVTLHYGSNDQPYTVVTPRY